MPATTVDRQCGSSQQAAHFAAQGVMAGAYDVVIAAGVEVMSQVPMGASIGDGKSASRSAPRVGQRYADVGGLVPQGISAELIADKWGLSREDLDAFGAESQRRAAQATDEGRFDNEIVAVRSIHRDKETRRRSPSPTSWSPPTRASARAPPPRRSANLKPAFKPDGKVTAGNSSQITDGASAALIMSEEKAARARPARRGPGSTPSPSPASTPSHAHRPDPATAQGARASPACRSTTSTCSRSTRPSPRSCWPGRRRPAPTWTRSTSTAAPSPSATRSACSGTKLLATLLNELERTGGRYGLQTMCEGGGMANATIIERLG